MPIVTSESLFKSDTLLHATHLKIFWSRTNHLMDFHLADLYLLDPINLMLMVAFSFVYYGGDIVVINV